MENEEKQPETQEEKKPYQPRPAWQVWGARVGLVVMIIIIVLSYLRLASGDLG